MSDKVLKKAIKLISKITVVSSTRQLTNGNRMLTQKQLLENAQRTLDLIADETLEFLMKYDKQPNQTRESDNG